ncbi:hypothetical protein R69619_03728 [Paraburkholderia nemoris]|nr:hypothetical protein R69619_03728 [Paraburkholderia nemoris]
MSKGRLRHSRGVCTGIVLRLGGCFHGALRASPVEIERIKAAEPRMDSHVNFAAN